jgi:hypothetical protein
VLAVGAGPATQASPVGQQIDQAVQALTPSVTRLSHANALRMAVTAYYRFRAARPGDVRKRYFYFVDYGLANNVPRGYVFDMDDRTLVDGPFTVAHGRGSSASRNGVPTTFTNVGGSAASSLGLYLTENTYHFSGTSDHRPYTSIGLRLRGQSGQFNSQAHARGVVVHGAPYVTSRDSGRSEGCPAMEEARAQRLIPMLANGSVVFLFSPNDPTWMANEPWVQPH